MKAKIFTGHKCTTGLHNALLDVVMPEFSSTAWKILCAIIRQTTGWERDEIGMGYEALMRATGIRSKATIASGIAEIEKYRYQLLAVTPGTQQYTSTYRVNREVEIDWSPVDFDTTSGSENEPLRSSKNELLKRASSSKNKLLRSSKNELSYRKEHDLLQNESEKSEKTLSDDEANQPSVKTKKATFTELKKLIQTTHKIASVPPVLNARLSDDVEALIGNEVTVEELAAFFASRIKRLPSIGYTCVDLLKWRVDTSWRPPHATPPSSASSVCQRCNGNGFYGTAQGRRDCERCKPQVGRIAA